MWRYPLISVVLYGWLHMTAESTESASLRHAVLKVSVPPTIDARWDKSPWTSVEPVSLEHHMGESPRHFPKTRAKVAYDDDALYVIFRVEDQYVRAVTTNYQGPVYQDSCVEFFFTPGGEVSAGYFNLEMNCGGTALFCFQKAKGKGVVRIPATDFDRVRVAHSMPPVVEPETELFVTRRATTSPRASSITPKK